MQQNRDRNGRPRNTRPYDLNRDVARTSAPSQDHTPRSTGSSRYGYNGEPLSRPPSRSANGSVRASRADNSIQFPTQTQSQTRRPAQGSNTTQYPSGSRPKNAKSGGKQRRPPNNARSGQSSRKNQNAQNHPNRQHPAGSQNQRPRPAQSAPQQSPARREMRKKRKVTRATLRRRRMLRRLTAFAMLLCVIGAGIYLTMTMLFRINSIQVQTPDGKQVTEIAGYSADSILQRMGVQLEENIFSFEPGEKAAVLEQNFPLLGSIKVIRDYPNTVVVQVTEAVPAYAVQNGSKWLVISDKWKILSEESTQPEGLCTLYGGKLQDTTPGQGFWFVDDADAASASGSEAAESESAVSTETARMEALRTLVSKLEEYGLSRAAAECAVGEPTLLDIARELSKPGRDPRDELPAPILRKDVLEMKDLKPGMELTGTVRNVIDFGVFVDIGVHQDGLVHISEVCKKRLRHPSEMVKVGDVVKVVVLNVDEKRHRISLSMKQAKQ